MISPNFQNWARCEKYLNDNKQNSFHLVRKLAQIFVLGHYLFLKAQTVRFSGQVEAIITKIVVLHKTKLHWMNSLSWNEVFRACSDGFVTFFCVTLQVTSRMVTPGLVRLKRKYPSQWKVTRTSVQYNRNLLRKSLSTRESVLCLSKSSFIFPRLIFSSYLDRLKTCTALSLITANMLFIWNQSGVQQSKNILW